jgi:putative transposase
VTFTPFLAPEKMLFFAKFLLEDQVMKRKKYTEEQIAFAHRQAEASTPIAEGGRDRADILSLEEEVCWHGVAELRKLKQLEEENRKLKQLVADLSFEKRMLQDVIQGKA